MEKKREIIISMFIIAIVDVLLIMTISICSGNQYVTSKEKSKKTGDISMQSSKSNISAGQKFSKEETKEKSESMISIYESLLIGKYNVKDNYKFSFSADRKFSGFFDDAHPNVKGYHYELIDQGENYVLNIYNQDKTSMVTYYVLLSNDGELQLFCPNSDVKIALSY